MAGIATGVLKNTKGGAGVLRDPAKSFRTAPDEIVVPARLARAFQLAEGATVSGPVQENKNHFQLIDVESICGLPPRDFQGRTPYTNLVAVNPSERFDLAACGDPTMRIVDLIAPIGKGTRGLIVSPPKAGKTMLLRQLAQAIHHAEPETRIVVLLIDERPEEVTDFRRGVPAEVLASSSDNSVEEHVELTELLLAHIRTELECGRNIVVLVDSLTRMGRTFNLKGSGTGRTMSGGMEARALEIPRRFFGLARNIENGGSVSILATALIDTGSRMDELIFEEFKGTGNSEIVLSRYLADRRVFPAIDIEASGTRREEELLGPEVTEKLALLRRAFAKFKSKEAMEKLLELIRKYPTNEQLLDNIPTR